MQIRLDVLAKDFRAYAENSGEKDLSERVCKQMVTAMARVLEGQDMCVLEKDGESNVLLRTERKVRCVPSLLLLQRQNIVALLSMNEIPACW